MYIIVGLGNPEKDYAGTRHNMGFDVINELAKDYNINIEKNKFKSLIGIGEIEENKVLLVKPQTYMNSSGEAVYECMNFYKQDIQDLLVVYDDMDVPKGRAKIRKKGGAGTHNGMKSIVNNLGETDFARVRVGIGKPDNKDDMINYVIGFVPEEDKLKLKEGIQIAKKAIIEILKNGIDIAMNKYN